MRWIAWAGLMAAACDQGKLEPPEREAPHSYGSDSIIGVYQVGVSDMEPPAKWRFRDIKLLGDDTLVDTTNDGVRRTIVAGQFSRFARELEALRFLSLGKWCGGQLSHGTQTSLMVSGPQGSNRVAVGVRCEHQKLSTLVDEIIQTADRAAR